LKRSRSLLLTFLPSAVSFILSSGLAGDERVLTE
jgi:hypothetical protein